MTDARPLAARVRVLAQRNLERMAYILGEHSAAALALAEMRERSAAGEDVVVYYLPRDNMIVVGPTLHAAADALEGRDG